MKVHANAPLGPKGRESLRALLSRAAGVSRERMRQLRSLLVTLHPPALESTGLEPVLEDLVAPLRARGIEVTVDVAGDVELPAPQLKLCFRAAQEGLRNVAQHADAANVAVGVGRTNGRVTLTVRDDGHGFSASTSTTGDATATSGCRCCTRAPPTPAAA